MPTLHRKLVVADLALAANDASDDDMAFVGAVEDGLGLLDLFGWDDGDEADAHVEGAQHLVLVHVAERLQMLEQRGYVPGGQVDQRAHALWEDARQVLRDAAAGDVGHAADDFGSC